MRRSLPGEIWRLIFTDIIHSPSVDEARRGKRGRPGLITLFNLCLVSKTFCYYAEPVLYSTFTPRYGHSLIRWAFTVLQSPRLAEHVREVELRPFGDYKWYCSSRWDESCAIDNIAYYSFFLELAQNLGIIDRDAELMYSDLQDICAEFHGRMWLFLHLLCVKLPNLDRLKVHTISPPEFPHFWTKTDLAPPHLRELRIEWSDELEMGSSKDGKVGMGIDLASLGDLLALPKLERLYLHRFITGVHHDQLSKNEARITEREISVNQTLTWLRCADCLLDQRTVHNMAAAFPNLENFEYYTGFVSSSDGVPDGVSGSEVLQALRPLADKLRRLSLDLVCRDNKKPLPTSQSYHIPSLAAFKGLEELSVDMGLVVQLQVKQAASFQEGDGEADDSFCEYFPPNLKRLRIIDVDEEIISSLAALSSNVDAWMSKLEEIELELQPGVINATDLVKQLDAEHHACRCGMSVSNWSILGRGGRSERVRLGPGCNEASMDSVVLPPKWRNIVDMFTSRGVAIKIGCVAKLHCPSYRLQARPRAI